MSSVGLQLRPKASTLFLSEYNKISHTNLGKRVMDRWFCRLSVIWIAAKVLTSCLYIKKNRYLNSCVEMFYIHCKWCYEWQLTVFHRCALRTQVAGWPSGWRPSVSLLYRSCSSSPQVPPLYPERPATEDACRIGTGATKKKCSSQSQTYCVVPWWSSSQRWHTRHALSLRVVLGSDACSLSPSPRKKNYTIISHPRNNSAMGIFVCVKPLWSHFVQWRWCF